MKTIAIVQARMGSKRFPRKSLIPLNNQSLLANVINAVKQNLYIDDIVVVTTNSSEDDAIEKECENLDIRCERGNSENVLSRFINIAKQLEISDQIVRVTADNPLNNIQASKQLFRKHITLSADYTCIDGLSHTVYEFIKAETFLKLEGKPNLTHEDKEHVTKYIRQHPNDFKILKISPQTLGINPEIDNLLTIDTLKDYQRLIELSKKLSFYSQLDYNKISEFLNKR